MLKLFLQILGWSLAHTPEFVLQVMARAVGQIMLYFMPRRRRLIYSNLHHAFPDRSPAWRNSVARDNSRNIIETLLLSLATPYLPDRRVEEIMAVRPSMLKTFEDHKAEAAPVLFGACHLTYWELTTALPHYVPKPFPEFGIIYRPLDNETAETWVKKTRERFGMKMLSRREGFQDAIKILRRKGFIAMLFDQNAGLQGAMSLFFGRVCSTTELTGLLTGKFGSRVYGVYPRRLGFWRFELCADRVTYDVGSATSATVQLNRWLEKTLTDDDNLCRSWLWTHDRWRNQDRPDKRLHLEAKRSLLDQDLKSLGLSSLPRKTRFWIRLPNWLGDVVMVLPLLRALRASRPDAEITLIGKAAFLPFLAQTGVADHLEPLPSRGSGYFRHFWSLRQRYPDVMLLFTHSTRGDLEAWLTRAPQRFGVVRQGKKRPLLTHRYRLPTSYVEREHHQFEIWEAYFRRFGLEGSIDRSPFFTPPEANRSELCFGFIAGSENTPEKRWPVPQWRTLMESLARHYPAARFCLFGTKNDQPITSAIAKDFDSSRVKDLAGKTDLPAYMDRLRACRLLISNDTGGMHLANALGVPLIALFGPTNPVRTGPIFNGPFTILQPPHTPATGGRPLTELSPATVLEAVQQLVPLELARE